VKEREGVPSECNDRENIEIHQIEKELLKKEFEHGRKFNK
jgi:hypothetical protein